MRLRLSVKFSCSISPKSGVNAILGNSNRRLLKFYKNGAKFQEVLRRGSFQNSKGGQWSQSLSPRDISATTLIDQHVADAKLLCQGERISFSIVEQSRGGQSCRRRQNLEPGGRRRGPGANNIWRFQLC